MAVRKTRRTSSTVHAECLDLPLVAQRRYQRGIFEFDCEPSPVLTQTRRVRMKLLMRRGVDILVSASVGKRVHVHGALRSSSCLKVFSQATTGGGWKD